MGAQFVDAYSLLHFAVGVVVRHWSMPLWLFILLHILFELVENTKYGMHFINTYLTIWPGGKPAADSILNSVGDTIFSAIGWIIADASLL
jgi:hypothetical protein